ncbi:MAG: hypothetical protein H6815_00530 [Phycisphaeraceae bacterium]|nr:hypothetical protein [Phycisphaeraceae bacterium]
MLKGNGGLGLVVTLVIGLFTSCALAGERGKAKRTPAPLAFVVADTNTALSHNDVYSIGSQRQYGTYEVVVRIYSVVDDLSLTDIVVALSADDWIVEQDPSGQELSSGESAYLRIRLQTQNTSSSPLTCPIIVTSSSGSTTYDPFVFTLRAESIDAEDEVSATPSLVSGTGSSVPSWVSADYFETQAAANFTRTPHQFIGWDLDTNAATTDSFYLGVHAAMEGGINRVEFYLNGTVEEVTEEIMEPGAATGEGVPGYYVEIDPANFSGSDVEKIEVYARVYANSPAAEPRVIGPWIAWVFPENVEPHVIECEPQTTTFASENDDDDALWKILLELMQSQSISTYGVGTSSNSASSIFTTNNPPTKPVVLMLPSGNHILPTNVSTFAVDTSSGVIERPDSVSGSSLRFDGWEVPLVITTESGAYDPTVTLLPSPVAAGTNAVPAASEVCAPVTILRNLRLNQHDFAYYEVQTTIWNDETNLIYIPVLTVFQNCLITNTDGRYALYTPSHQLATDVDDEGIRPAPMISVSQGGSAFYEFCSVKNIDRGLVGPSFVRGKLASESKTFSTLAGSVMNNPQVVLNVTAEKINTYPPRADVEFGVLTWHGGTNGGMRKVGSNSNVFTLNDSETDIERGALLLYENGNPTVPKHVLVLGKTSPNAPTPIPNLTSWTSYTNTPIECLTADALDDALTTIAANLGGLWSYTSLLSQLPSPPTVSDNGRGMRYLTRDCEPGMTAFPIDQNDPYAKVPPNEAVTLVAAIDTHSAVMQWFATGGNPIDNRMVWGFEYDQVEDPVGSGCRDRADPTGLEVQQLTTVSDPGIYNSSILAMRIRNRVALAGSGGSVQAATSGSLLQAPMSNVLIAHCSFEHHGFGLSSNMVQEQRLRFEPSWVRVRNCFFEALAAQHPTVDPNDPYAPSPWGINFSGIADCTAQASGVPSLMVFPDGIEQIAIINCHYTSACQMDPSSMSNPYGIQNPMFCSSGPTTSAASYWFGTYPFDDGGCSWGLDADLGSDGRPNTNSPLLSRTCLPILKFGLFGDAIPANTGSIGALQP